jgi:membrane protease YdiL (CAAX protease family)
VIQSGADRVRTFDNLHQAAHHAAETDPATKEEGHSPNEGPSGRGNGSVGDGSAPAPTLPPKPRLALRLRVLGPRRVAVAIMQIALCSGLPTQFVLLVVLSAFGVQSPSTTKEWSLSFVAGVLVADSALVLGLILLFLRWSAERPRDVFLGRRSVAWEWSLGIALVPMAFVVIAAINVIVQRYAPTLHQAQNPFQPLVQTPYGMVIFTSLSILAGGVREEMQRAFALHRFTQIGIPYAGLIVFSVIFGLGHIVQGWDAAIMTGSLGALWGYVYLRRGSIVAPAVCHGAFDAIQVIAFGLLRR